MTHDDRVVALDDDRTQGVRGLGQHILADGQLRAVGALQILQGLGSALDLRLDLAQPHCDVAEVGRIDALQLQDVEQVLLPALGLAQGDGQVLAPLRTILPPGFRCRFDIADDGGHSVWREDLVQDRARYEFIHLRSAHPLLVFA
ncbi:hypothetical protein [Herbaspirillum sp.]|uniref:hypothetical protein n=1 Tax=Herbaspirillum TaxID=963 RepID=UPI0025798511|nr:hypothetical protein [Herbaspirillum sp.]